MSTTVNLGRVKGNAPLINGNEITSIVGSGGLEIDQTGDTAKLSFDTDIIQAKIIGECGQYVGFDENGDPVPVGDTYELYGFELNMDETEPSNMIRYIADNANYNSAHMDFANGVFDYGDWGNAFFIKNLKPCMLNYNGTVAYELDKNDYSKKADGTASDVANSSFAGNAMVGIPTIWVKVDTSVARKPKFYFSNRQLDSSYKCYAHHDNNGNVMSYTYIAAYDGSCSDATKVRSLSGLSSMSLYSGVNSRNYAKANNPSGSAIWDIGKIVDRQLINLLLLLIGKSTDSQGVFGYGNCNGRNNPASGSGSLGILPTGTLNNKGLFFGYSESQADNLAVKVFGIENWWGNVRKWNLGLCSTRNKIYYKLTYGTEDGTTSTGFDIPLYTSGSYTTSVPSGWLLATEVTYPSSQSGLDVVSGNINDMVVGNYGLIPKELVVGDGKYRCLYSVRNYMNYGQSEYVGCAAEGGAQNSGDYGGVFGASLHNEIQLPSAIGDGTASFSISLSCKPLVS